MLVPKILGFKKNGAKSWGKRNSWFKKRVKALNFWVTNFFAFKDNHIHTINL